MRAHVSLLALALLGCGEELEGGGTAVGNPGKTVVRMAPSGSAAWETATADLTVVQVGCNGEEERSTYAGYDLVGGPDVPLADGVWCALTAEVTNLVATGPLLLEVPEASATLDLTAAPEGDMGPGVFELGEPSAPQAIAGRSAWFSDLQEDGLIDLLERSRGPVVSEDSRQARDAFVPEMLVVGGGQGLLGALPAPDAPAYTSEAGDVAISTLLSLGGSEFLALGGRNTGVQWRTTDAGLTWTEESSSAPSLEVTSGVVVGDTLVITAGADILSSDDKGASWVPRGTAPAFLRSLAHNGTTLVAVGLNVVGRAGTDLQWTWDQPGGLPDLYEVAHGPPGFVAVGLDGARWSSQDGALWTEKANGGTKLQSVLWTGSQFYAAGQDGDAWVSTNGQAWSPAPTPKASPEMVMHQGRFIAIEGSGVYVSDDEGLTWQQWAFVPPRWLVTLATNQPEALP